VGSAPNLSGLSPDDRTRPTPARDVGRESPRTGPSLTRALWVVQGLLAAVFLFAGGAKLVLPLDQMTGPVALPGWFLRFLGVAEVLGALGLVLPGLLHIRPGLTPLAAAGLVIIMVGATVLTWASGMVAVALTNVVVGLLAAFVAYGRWRLAPHR
jgi:DoxX-like family